MTGRSVKGHLAFVSTGLLSLLNLAATIGGIGMIVIIFSLEHTPSKIGWLFIIVGSFTVTAGILGVFFSNRRGCFTWQLVILLFSLLGLIASALLIFFKNKNVLNSMNYKNSETSARKIIKLEGATFFITFCVNVTVTILGICVNCCDLVDYYEDLEMTNRNRPDLGRTQLEADRRAAKKEDSKASQLAQKMKSKYGKWTGDTEFDPTRRT